MDAPPTKTGAGASEPSGVLMYNRPAYARAILAPGLPLSRRDALQALLAFSALHQQVRLRRARNLRSQQAGVGAEDLLAAEQFVLDEVLGLVAERALAITGADGVAIALAEGDAIICRGSAGIIAPDAGAKLDPKSGFSGACFRSGEIVRCDDVETDPRVDLQACRRLDTRSVVAVPLYGRHTVVGLLEAFSRDAYAFNDSDVRSLSLLAELIVAALKPEEELRLRQAAKAAVEASLQDVAARPAPVAHSPHSSSPFAEREYFNEADEASDFPAYQSSFWSSPGLMVVAIVMVIAGLLAGGLYWKIRNAPPKVTVAAVIGKPQPPATVPQVDSSAESDIPPSTQAASSSSSSAQADMLVPGSTSVRLSEGDSSAAPQVAQTEAQSSLERESKQASAAAPPRINGIRHWSSATASTVVIDLQDQVPYEVHRLNSPERIYFDLHDTVLPSALQGKMIEIGDAQVSRVRLAQPVAGVTRVVLDTKGGSNFSVSLEQNPYRLVVEVRGLHSPSAETRAKVDLSPPAGEHENKTRKTAAMARDKEDEQLRAHVPKFRIVLDAGHGGWDLGTVGRKGLMEKDLVLDIVQRLGELLEGRLGSEVIYTRKEDAYISLDQRADVANQAQADLFVSIHANYSDLTSARGVETYYTDLFEAPGSKEIEKRENGSPKKAVMPASLSTNGLRDKVEGSRQLAAAVQRSLFDTLSQLSPSIRNRGVKRASFVVLTGTAMPSILAEVSFVSSPRDEQNLQNAKYRQRIATALYKGIARYAAGTPRVKMASASAASTGQ
jgi:N-acetylmuramoyl-L-alanine amidase